MHARQRKLEETGSLISSTTPLRRTESCFICISARELLLKDTIVYLKLEQCTDGVQNGSQRQQMVLNCGCRSDKSTLSNMGVFHNSKPENRPEHRSSDPTAVIAVLCCSFPSIESILPPAGSKSAQRTHHSKVCPKANSTPSHGQNSTYCPYCLAALPRQLLTC